MEQNTDKRTQSAEKRHGQTIEQFGNAVKIRGCKSHIVSSVTSIGGSAFYNCGELTNIIVAEGNAVYHSFGNCIIQTASKNLIVGCKASVIPNDGSVTSIGSSAFYNCSGLTSITIPDRESISDLHPTIV